MEVDFFLIEKDGKTSIHRDEFSLGRLLVIPRVTLQNMVQSKRRKSVQLAKSYDTVVHISADGQRYAVAFSGEMLSALETDALISKSVPRPLPF
ncbi:hypothetical protein ABK905_24895 [Acerihabitans sp. KWT182]|uniref:DUF370 domain-containing protein n=1 Tax=Acerihabitans sp. KWT182 TaxID=3157919 RepID=A0AAU7Q935_9GAMM